jgi:hypothetical protein
MLNCIKAGSRRKLRLFACACCRHIWELISDERSQKAVIAAELWADGLLSTADLRTLQLAAALAQDEHTTSPASRFGDATSEALCAASAVALPNKAWIWTVANHMRAAWYAANGRTKVAMLQAEGAQVRLLREIFGNPFRRMAIDPAWAAWHDGAAIKLAHHVYEERAFYCLPDLPETLREAGCNDAAILDHCRQKEPHVRGCWVVDLLLGKE